MKWQIHYRRKIKDIWTLRKMSQKKKKDPSKLEDINLLIIFQSGGTERKNNKDEQNIRDHGTIMKHTNIWIMKVSPRKQKSANIAKRIFEDITETFKNLMKNIKLHFQKLKFLRRIHKGPHLSVSSLYVSVDK